MTDIEELNRNLGDPNEETRHLAVQTLASLGTEALPLLGSALGDESWRVRKAALEAFVSIPGEEKMDILLAGIRDEGSAGRRNTCMEALIRLGSLSIPHLPSLLGDEDADVRKFGVDILGNIDDVKTLDSLLSSLDDPEDNVAAAAAEYLGRKGRREAVGALMARARKGGFWVKYSCLKSLGDIGDPAAGPVVLEAAGVRDLRKVALEALGKMGVAEAGPYVTEGLFSEDRGLRKIAVVSASRLLRNRRLPPQVLEALREAIRSNAGEIFIGHVLELMGSDDQELRTAAMTLLGVSAGKDAVGPLLEILPGVGEEEQGFIADVLGDLPDADLCALFPKLRDEQPVVRRWLARVLGQRECQAAVPHLVGLLEDENGHVRGEAARALGRIGDRLAVAPLVSLLGDPYPDVRQAGADALGVLGGSGEEMKQLVLTFLGPQLDSKDQDLVTNALRVVARLGSREVLDRLKFAIKDERSQVRRAAVEALGVIEGSEAVEVLRLALTDEDATVRREAVQKLGERRGEGTLPILVPMLQDEDLWVRVRAVQAVAGQGGEEAQALLLETVRSEATGPVKLAAMRALGQIGGEAARDLLLELATSGARESRMAAIEALGRIGGPEAMERLIACLKDEEWGMRSAAVRALAGFTGEDVARRAVEAVAREDADPMVRKVATDLLGLSVP